MKKGLIVAAAATMLMLNACTEVGPFIDFSTARAEDTTYETTPETPDMKAVLVEEYTGVQCTNCPAAATLLKNYETSHPGKIIVAGLHAGALADPVTHDPKSKYDFRNADVLNMVNSYFGENPPKPAAVLDRVKTNGFYFNTNRTTWTAVLDQRGGLTAPVNIDLETAYSDENREVTVTVTVSYTQEVTEKQSLSVWLVEDKLIDVQLYPGSYDSLYEHNHVMRGYLTPVIGASILDSIATKKPGRVFRKVLPAYKVKEDWNPDNCRIIAFVHNNEQDNKEVAQAAEAHIK